MNFIDKTVSFFNPRAGLARAMARAALGSYEAASSGRRRSGVGGARSSSANVAVGSSLRALRDRARDLVRNTGHGSAMVERFTGSLIGSGITPLWETGSDRRDKQINDLWEQFVKRADVEGEIDFYAMQSLSARSMIEGGEMVSRFIDLRLSDDRDIPLRLQLMEGDHIDSSRDALNIDGRRVRLGVGLGDYNRRLGYYLFKNHPSEVTTGADYISNFVPRDQLLHLYRATRIGQIRGVSWLAPILLPAADHADLMRNTIVKSGIEAAFSGFIKNTGGGPANIGATVNRASGDREFLPEPGTLAELGHGQDIVFAEPKTTTQFESVAMATLQAMAVGIGLTYDQLTGDLRQANYSSLRAGKIEHRRLVEQLQWHLIIPKFCDPIADRFVDRMVLAGSLRGRREDYRREWVPPANEPIDPKKDLEADISAVRAGRMSPQEFIGMWGRHWKKVVKDSAEFWAAVDAAKQTYDIDPRRPRNGSTVAPLPIDAEPSDEDEAGQDKSKSQTNEDQ